MRLVPATRSQSTRKLSRLELALMAAYPSCPSDGEVLAVRQLGFSNVDEAAETAIATNRDFKANLPVPLWEESLAGRTANAKGWNNVASGAPSQKLQHLTIEVKDVPVGTSFSLS